MPVITFANPKGGSGKSTAALMTASELATRGAKVIVIDGDPNANIFRWAQERGEIAYDADQAGLPDDDDAALAAARSILNGLHIKKFAAIKSTQADAMSYWLEAAAGLASFVVLDPEGTANEWVNEAIIRSDMVVIPLNPSPMDMEQAARTRKLVMRHARSLGRTIPHYFLFSRKSAIATNHERSIRESLNGAGATVLSTSLLERAAFRAVFMEYKTLAELEDTDARNLGTARRNASELVAELVSILKNIQEAA
jgi:chromosome partitioning protein